MIEFINIAQRITNLKRPCADFRKGYSTTDNIFRLQPGGGGVSRT